MPILPLLSLTSIALAAPTSVALTADGEVLVHVSDASSVADASVKLSSDAGSETVSLSSSPDLYGAANVDAPATAASATVELYDSVGAVVATLSGAVDPDGTLSLSVLDTDALELLGADTFDAPAGGLELGLELGGAAAASIASGQVVLAWTVTEVTCEKGGACTETEVPYESATALTFDAIGSTWSGVAGLAHTGEVSAKVKTTNARGKAVASFTARLGSGWTDDASGIPSLSIDEDPLTSVAIVAHGSAALVAVSDGWSVDGEVPVSASFDLGDGKTTTVPANSYQRPADTRVVTDPELRSLASTIVYNFGNGDVATSAYGCGVVIICDNGNPIVCGVADIDCGLELTATAASLAGLPEETEVTVRYLDAEGMELGSESTVVGYDADVSVVFAAPFDTAGDPHGADVAGSVRLMGEPGRKGKAATLAKGKFSATIGYDPDGDLAVWGADKGTAMPEPGVLDLLGAYTALPPVVVSLSSGPGATEKHGDILIDGVPIDYD